MLQVGAQNQKATGWPAREVASSWPPPTSGAVNPSASAAGSSRVAAVSELAPPALAPQPARVATTARTKRDRRITLTIRTAAAGRAGLAPRVPSSFTASVTSDAVSTRKLIGVALLCGLAILIAGGIQLFRISDTGGRTVAVLAEGESATVGGINVTVEGSERDEAAIRVRVSVAATGGDTTVPLSAFTLLVGGVLERGANETDGSPPACPASLPATGAGLSCTVRFAPRDGTATLGFSRGGEQRIWRLDPASA